MSNTKYSTSTRIIFFAPFLLLVLSVCSLTLDEKGSSVGLLSLSALIALGFSVLIALLVLPERLSDHHPKKK